MEQINSKILLFGEYAVLHNGKALVIPCEKYGGRFEFSDNAEDKAYAIQSNEYLKRFCEFIANRTNEKFVLEVKQFEKELDQGLFFRSNIPQGYGLGSSGAIVAAMVLRYLKKAKNVKDEVKLKLFELKANLGELESHFHGVSSGLDPLSIILNEPILYKNAEEIETAKLPESSPDKKNVVFLLNTNLPRQTASLVGNFKQMYSEEGFKKKFDEYVINYNNKAIDNFLTNDLDNFYKSMYSLSSFQLMEMGGFFPHNMQKLLAEGLEHGDYYLKLCGAGGGGFMLGFTKDWEKTQEILHDQELDEIYRF